MVVANELLGQNRKENYGFYILVYHVDFISRGAPVYGAMGVKWTTLTFKELAAQRTLRMDASYWSKKKKKEAASNKRQAASAKQQAPSNKHQAPSKKRVDSLDHP